nr:MAG: hypothetical protein [Cressdnaviricota sp.]
MPTYKRQFNPNKYFDYLVQKYDGSKTSYYSSYKSKLDPDWSKDKVYEFFKSLRPIIQNQYRTIDNNQRAQNAPKNHSYSKLGQIVNSDYGLDSQYKPHKPYYGDVVQGFDPNLQPIMLPLDIDYMDQVESHHPGYELDKQYGINNQSLGIRDWMYNNGPSLDKVSKTGGMIGSLFGGPVGNALGYLGGHLIGSALGSGDYKILAHHFSKGIKAIKQKRKKCKKC